MKFECILDSKIYVFFLCVTLNRLTIVHNSCNLLSKVALVKVTFTTCSTDALEHTFFGPVAFILMETAVLV